MVSCAAMGISKVGSSGLTLARLVYLDSTAPSCCFLSLSTVTNGIYCFILVVIAGCVETPTCSLEPQCMPMDVIYCTCAEAELVTGIFS